MKTRTGVLAIGVACAACCAPLVFPLLAGAGLGTAGAAAGALLFGLTLDQIVCFGLPGAILIAFVVVWWRRRALARRADGVCPTQCAVETCPTTGRHALVQESTETC